MEASLESLAKRISKLEKRIGRLDDERALQTTKIVAHLRQAVRELYKKIFHIDNALSDVLMRFISLNSVCSSSSKGVMSKEKLFHEMIVYYDDLIVLLPQLRKLENVYNDHVLRALENINGRSFQKLDVTTNLNVNNSVQSIIWKQETLLIRSILLCQRNMDYSIQYQHFFSNIYQKLADLKS